jgi:hypothetical protein
MCFGCDRLCPLPPLPARLSACLQPTLFSLGAMAFELLTWRQLLLVGRHQVEHESRVRSLPLMGMTGGFWLWWRVGHAVVLRG